MQDRVYAPHKFPSEHRKRIRTTNLLERTFVEVRRRTKVIGRFPGETSALTLIWAVLELSSRGLRLRGMLCGDHLLCVRGGWAEALDLCDGRQIRDTALPPATPRQFHPATGTRPIKRSQITRWLADAELISCPTRASVAATATNDRAWRGEN